MWNNQIETQVSIPWRYTWKCNGSGFIVSVVQTFVQQNILEKLRWTIPDSTTQPYLPSNPCYQCSFLHNCCIDAIKEFEKQFKK